MEVSGLDQIPGATHRRRCTAERNVEGATQRSWAGHIGFGNTRTGDRGCIDTGMGKRTHVESRGIAGDAGGPSQGGYTAHVKRTVAAEVDGASAGRSGVHTTQAATGEVKKPRSSAAHHDVSLRSGFGNDGQVACRHI